VVSHYYLYYLSITMHHPAQSIWGCPMYRWKWGRRINLLFQFNNLIGVFKMATTGELRTIIEELQLVDIGDAASYLGEEAVVREESSVQSAALPISTDAGLLPASADLPYDYVVLK
jgi:hypothetical protein